MNLERRVEQLEQQAGDAEEPMLLVLVGLRPGGVERPEAVGYATEGRRWMREAGETAEHCLERIKADLLAEGPRMLPFLTEIHEEATA